MVYSKRARYVYDDQSYCPVPERPQRVLFRCQACARLPQTEHRGLPVAARDRADAFRLELTRTCEVPRWQSCDSCLQRVYCSSVNPCVEIPGAGLHSHWRVPDLQRQEDCAGCTRLRRHAGKIALGSSLVRLGRPRHGCGQL